MYQHRRPGAILSLVKTLSLASFAHGQTTQKVPRIGFLAANNVASTAPRLKAFRQRLQELGYVEVENCIIEDRYAVRRFDRLPALAAELVDLNVDLIVTAGGMDTRAIKNATNTIPFVMIAVDYHPIDKGYVQSLAKIGGNITRLFFQQLALTKERLQLRQEIVPNLPGATIFWDRASADKRQTEQISAAELSLPIKGVELPDEPYDFEHALEQLPEHYRAATSGLASPIFLVPDRRRLPDFASCNRLPAMFINRACVSLGGLMSHCPSFAQMYRWLTDCVDQFLNGATPGRLPIEQPTTIALLIKLTTAQLLGIDVPQSLLLQADELLE